MFCGHDKHKTPTLLLVDDEEPFTDMLRINLEMATDYHVVAENDSRQALATIRRCRPDLVLLDAMMPGKDGLEILRQIENDEELHDTPVIFLSAISHKLTADIFQVGHLEQRRILGKPVRIGQLVEEIESELSSFPPTHRNTTTNNYEGGMLSSPIKPFRRKQ